MDLLTLQPKFQNALDKTKLQEEISWIEKSHAIWLQVGDRNYYFSINLLWHKNMLML